MRFGAASVAPADASDEAAAAHSLFARLELSTRISPHSRLLELWNDALCVAALYSVVAAPLLIVFPQTRYPGRDAVEGWLDAAFVISIFIKLRTTFLNGDGTAPRSCLLYTSPSPRDS